MLVDHYPKLVICASKAHSSKGSSVWNGKVEYKVVGPCFQSPFVAFLRASVEPRFLLPIVSVIQRQTA